MQRLNKSMHLRLHGRGRSKGERLLIVNCTVEAQSAAVLRLDLCQIPVTAAPLNRIQDIDAHFDQTRQQGAHVAIVMMKDLQAIRFRQIEPPAAKEPGRSGRRRVG